MGVLKSQPKKFSASLGLFILSWLNDNRSAFAGVEAVLVAFGLKLEAVIVFLFGFF